MKIKYILVKCKNSKNKIFFGTCQINLLTLKKIHFSSKSLINLQYLNLEHEAFLDFKIIFPILVILFLIIYNNILHLFFIPLLNSISTISLH